MRLSRLSRLALAAALSLPAALPAVVAAAPAGAVASRCGPGQTALGGSLAGYPDRAPLNAVVHVELTDASTRRAYDVYRDGRVDTTGRPAGTRYSLSDHVNPGRTPQTAPLHLDRTWGGPDDSGVLCFTDNPRITQAYIEIYPRRPVDDDGDGRTDRYVTDRSRYGAAAHYRQPVRVGADNAGIALRLPQTIASRVGYVHGYLTYRGRAVPVAAPGCGTGGRVACHGVTTVRAFPTDLNGPGCGIEGFSASADRIDPRARSGAATYFRIDALAGGDCGAATQSYSVRVTCVSACGRNASGGPVRTLAPATRPAVRAGAGVRADIRS